MISIVWRRAFRVAESVLCGMLALAFVNTATAANNPAGQPLERRYERPEGWLGEIQADLSEAQYHFLPAEPQPGESAPGAWSAANRAHAFRIVVNRVGVRIVSRTDPVPTWELRLALTGYGRGTTEHPVEQATLATQDRRVTCHRAGIVEQYTNDRSGLEQAFELHAPPGIASSDGPAYLSLDLGGSVSPRLDAEGQSIDFLAPTGGAVVRYAKLVVNDALGRRLASWMELSADGANRRIRLVFDDAGAVYPVTVDPLATAPVWTAEGDQYGAVFGFSVDTAGDVNGDGYSDVIVGAFSYDNGENGEGRAFVFHGSASGVVTSAAWTAEGDQPGANFGRQVAAAGDVNGDGYADVIIACPYYDNGETDEGRAFVYHGSPSGLGATPAWTGEPDQENARIVSATGAGDVNGDGYADVIYGAMIYDNGESNEGRAFVHHGSPAGLETTPAWFAESDQADSIFGARVASAGDVNGDGYADVLVGAYFFDNPEPNEGRAYVFHGSPTGLESAPAWMGESGQAFGEFGDRLAAGDLNGDGFSDIIVGAHEYDNGEVDEGILYVFHGSAAGVQTAPAWIGEGNQVGAFYASSLASADINGDGYADLLVGANYFDNGEEDEGQAYVHLGSADGVNPTPAWVADGNQEGANFGWSVASAGDVNGDGYSDLIVGAPLYDGPDYNEGRAYVFLGAASGLASGEGWTAESGQGGAELGLSVRAAGDVNGDGFSDVIVGAPGYDNGESDEGRAFIYHGTQSGPETTPAWSAESDQAGARFGHAVNAAGDVDGDGYSDVIVGAHLYDNGQADEGRAFVYRGTASGVEATPVWSVESDQVDSRLGSSVGTAGDVDGDGYSDVIVGAPLHDDGQTDEGRALVYRGSAAGLEAREIWIADGNQNAAQFGHAVGTAGDVDGDGHSDVIVGAPLYDNGQADEGRAFVYRGSPSGPEPIPAWTAESQQASARFGHAVATAGDLDGDGYSDVIVGAPLYDNNQVDEGRIFSYQGSADGLTSVGRKAESNQTASDFGWSIAPAGDVNGDGFSDVIVGAPGFDNTEIDAGRVFVYLGSSFGLAPSSAWTADGDQASAGLGSSVAGAGDFDGDGFSDVVVGAPSHDGAHGDQGRVSVYFGNGGSGLDRVPRQARAGADAPIDILGRSDSESSFRLKARGRTAAGRGKVWLEWEVEPLGTPFDGQGIGKGPLTDTGEPSVSGSAVDLVSSVDGRTTGPYHWRLRVASASPYFPRTPWFSPSANNPTETDLRVVCATEILAEVEQLGLLADKQTLEWTALAPGVAYDVVRGMTMELPVGAGAAESCLAAGITETSAGDDSEPSSGKSYWYLVRGRNACGIGSYGTTSSDEERTTSICP